MVGIPYPGTMVGIPYPGTMVGILSPVYHTLYTPGYTSLLLYLA